MTRATMASAGERLTAIRNCATACLPIAHLDADKPPHMQNLFVSRQYCDLRWRIYDLSGSNNDFDEWFAACREAGIDTGEYLERVEIPALPRTTTPIRKLDPSIWGDLEAAE